MLTRGSRSSTTFNFHARHKSMDSVGKYSPRTHYVPSRPKPAHASGDVAVNQRENKGPKHTPAFTNSPEVIRALSDEDQNLF